MSNVWGNYRPRHDIERVFQTIKKECFALPKKKRRDFLFDKMAKGVEEYLNETPNDFKHWVSTEVLYEIEHWTYNPKRHKQ